MSARIEMRSFPEPPRIAGLELDLCGRRIPAWARRDSRGQADLTDVDLGRWLHMAQFRLCGLCGNALGRHLTFVGSLAAIKRRVFRDVPLHHDCACYAMRINPRLGAPKMDLGRVTVPARANLATGRGEIRLLRPARFGLAVCTHMEICLLADGSPGLLATHLTHVSFWEDGRVVGTERPSQ